MRERTPDSGAVPHHYEGICKHGVALYERLARWLETRREVPVLAKQAALFAPGLFGTYGKLAHLRRALREASLLLESDPKSAMPLRERGTPPATCKTTNPFRRQSVSSTHSSLSPHS